MKRVELLVKDPQYKEYLQRNFDEQREPRYCQHDFRHHLDVARITYILVLEHNDLNYFIKESGLSGKLAAKEVIYAAGLTHDLGKWNEYQTGTDHASYGAKLGREILPRVYFNPNEVEIICRAIFEHRNISLDMSFLGERLHRADNLSRVCVECDFSNQCPKLKSREPIAASFEY